LACEDEVPASKAGDGCDSGATALAVRVRQFGAAVSSKNKGGREAKKPKAAHNVKTTGQTPPPGPVDAINHKVRPKQ
jgi:hypothetical protein